MTEAGTPTTPDTPESAASDQDLREIAIDWDALEDAFENNAPEVHSYLQLGTGEVIRVVDGVADPQMHARIAGDSAYLRIDPVSSREQYRWMERFIPAVDSADLRARLQHAIDGKGAFRRFKDALMSHAADRERWFTFRSERLRTFMEAWLAAHNLKGVPRPAWTVPESTDVAPAEPEAPHATEASPADTTAAREPRRRQGEALRRQLRELADALGARDLEVLVTLGDFLRARRQQRAAASDGEGHDVTAHESGAASDE